jgi:hypothetical protein
MCTFLPKNICRSVKHIVEGCEEALLFSFQHCTKMVLFTAKFRMLGHANRKIYIQQFTSTQIAFKIIEMA